MRNLLIIAVIACSACASGGSITAAARPIGPVAPCPGWEDYRTARTPDGRSLLAAYDSLAQTPAARGEERRQRRGARPDTAESKLYGLRVSHPARIRSGDREMMRRLFEETYPADLRIARIGGTVRMTLLVDTDGTVRETRISRSSGHASLDRAATTLINRAPLDPAIAGSCGIPYIVTLPVVYRVGMPNEPTPTR